MSERIPIRELTAAIMPNLVTCREWGDASFISLPIVYPSGSFVTVRLTHCPAGVRVSDAGFAYREAESFGAGRSFSQTARPIAETLGVDVGRRALFADVPEHEVERAIFDVSAASHAVAEKIVTRASADAEADISAILHERLDAIFAGTVEHDGKIRGASSTEWEVTAITKRHHDRAVFLVVPNFAVSVYKASTAFHDLAALDNPPHLVSVVKNKAEMRSHYSILAQAGRVIEVDQPDDAYLRAAA